MRIIIQNDLVQNGQVNAHDGYRALVFGKHFNLTPVVKRQYSGPTPNQATWQRLGEHIFEFRWGPSERSTLRYAGGWTLMEEVPVWQSGLAREIWTAVFRRYPWALGFLCEDNRGPSVIPEEVVPESQYLANVSKRRRIEVFQSRFGVELPESAFTSAKQGLRLEPQPLGFDPDAYLGWETSLRKPQANINRSEAWYGSNGEGFALRLIANPQSEHVDSEKGRLYSPGSPGIRGWREWRYLIRVQFGAYVHNDQDSSSYGCKVDVWMVNPETKTA